MKVVIVDIVDSRRIDGTPSADEGSFGPDVMVKTIISLPAANGRRGPHPDILTLIGLADILPGSDGLGDDDQQPRSGAAPAEQEFQTFTILDAAKIRNLPEILEASGLEHRCLFQGQAKDEMGASAPWLVRLVPGARIARKLFMDQRSNGFWDLAAATFLRSQCSFDEIWRHLRRFTRLQDADGKWLLFRFWDAQSLMMLQLSQSLSGARRFFSPYHRVIIPVPAEGLCVVFTRASASWVTPDLEGVALRVDRDEA